MKPALSRKLKTLALICLSACFAGVIFQLIAENNLTYASVLIGLPLGLFFGLLELFIFPLAEIRFRKWPFTKIFIFKAVVYTTVIYIVTITIATIDGLLTGRQLMEIRPYFFSTGQLVLVLYTLVIFSLLLFILQVNQLLGDGVLWKFILGKYHRPREEERIFMFLDMKSSTAIAEKLGHVRFYTLLNEVFHEISKPVLLTKAEIYQYVGDEIVLTWELNQGLENANCLKTFFMFRDNLLQRADHYKQLFGVQPEFKAGLHCGKVISAQIGDLKREIVYNGDVVNTTSRIQSECNTYQKEFLVSGLLLQKLNVNGEYHSERIDTVTFRGKEKEVELYSIMIGKLNIGLS